ncbi:MAG: hypothetical protein HYV09_24930 [Deltaproteobacteria bacterium]|nr:hypothetical protein [Deltaproteobacteria bacterium]
MRFARLLGIGSVASLAMFTVACGGDDKPPGAVVTQDTGADTALPPDTEGDTSTPDTGDTTVGDTTVVDTGADAKTDTTVTDTATEPDVPLGTDAMFIPDTLLDATKIEGGVPDAGGDEVFGDSTVGPDASSALVPVGTACTTSAACDPTGAGVGICSSQFAPPDTLDPSPSCMALACEGGSADVGKSCGLGGAGLCIPGGAKGHCLDKCTFGSTGAASGCLGKTGCRPWSWTRVGGGVTGTGYCSAGCGADADCSAGQKCQTESGYCVATVTTYPKAVGATCTASSECACRINALSGLGYCVKACKTGDATAGCPTGFTCDPGLPATDTGGALFSGVPSGLLGICWKNCTTDAECTPLGGHCESNTATGVKVCRVP